MLKMKVAPKMLLKTKEAKRPIFAYPIMYMKTNDVSYICQYVYENKSDRHYFQLLNRTYQPSPCAMPLSYSK